MPTFDTAAMLADLADLVAVESPSDDLDACMRSADAVAALGRRVMGHDAEIHGVADVRWRLGMPRVLVLGHHDTVWPLGTLDRWPFEVRDGRASGPGCFDMKAGIVIALHAVAALDDPTGVAILVTGDEEIGAPRSRGLIEDTAAGLEATVVAEPSAAGALKIARKGLRNLRLVVEGRAAHAGLEPELGVNAAVELAHQLTEIARWDLPGDTTLVPTLLSGGTTMNTVPVRAEVQFDMRSSRAEHLDAVTARMAALAPRLDGARLAVERLHGRGPLEEPMSRSLHDVAQAVAHRLGHDLPEAVAVGGVSDGNITASLGVPTLDGLGAVGDGAHREGEWVDVDSLAERAALLHGLLAQVLAGGAP